MIARGGISKQIGSDSRTFGKFGQNKTKVAKHLGCFHVLATIHSAAMNIGVHVSLSILVSSVCMPSGGIAES